MVGKCIHFIDRDKRKTKKQKNKQKMQKYAEFLMTHFFKKKSTHHLFTSFLYFSPYTYTHFGSLIQNEKQTNKHKKQDIK